MIWLNIFVLLFPQLLRCSAELWIELNVEQLSIPSYVEELQKEEEEADDGEFTEEEETKNARVDHIIPLKHVNGLM